MKRVVSYALFRHPAGQYEDPRAGVSRGVFYNWYLPLLVRAHHECWPGWELRIHHDETLYAGSYGGELLRLERAGLVSLRYMGKAETLCGSMLWRLAPAWDPEVEIVACRDVDALPQPRDRAAVERFVAGPGAVHVIHDHPAHAGVMGGTLAVRASAVRERLGETFAAFVGSIRRDLNRHGADQDVLGERLVPDVVDDKLAPVDERDRVPIGAAFPVAPQAEFYRGREHAARAEIEAAERYVSPRPLAGPRVVLSSDLNHDYSFYVPLTAALWRDVVGFRPTVLLTGTCDEWRAHPQGSVALRHAREIGADVHWIGPVSGHRSSTVAQVARLYAACLDLPDDTRLLTADVDMWPLSDTFRGLGEAEVDLHYGNAYEHEAKPKWPICYIGADARTWREIMDVAVEPLGQVVQLRLDERLGSASAQQAWFHDEEDFARRLTAWPRYKDRCVSIPRRGQPPADRIDRSAWPLEPRAAGMVDAHLPRPGWDKWYQVRPLIKQVAPHLVGWADGYCAEFRKAF